MSGTEEYVDDSANHGLPDHCPGLFSSQTKNREQLSRIFHGVASEMGRDKRKLSAKHRVNGTGHRRRFVFTPVAWLRYDHKRKRLLTKTHRKQAEEHTSDGAGVEELHHGSAAVGVAGEIENDSGGQVPRVPHLFELCIDQLPVVPAAAQRMNVSGQLTAALWGSFTHS
jgi:hypothetical protein